MWKTLLILILAVFCQFEAIAQEKSLRQPPGVVVRFEGGIVGSNIAKVLTIANSQEPVPTVRYQPKTSDTLCGVLLSLGYPPPCEPLAEFIGRLNNDPALAAGKFDISKGFLVPNLNLTRYRSTQTYSTKNQRDVARTSNLSQSWSGLKPQSSKRTEHLVDFGFDAFEIFIPTSSDQMSNTIASRIFALNTTNILIDILKVKLAPSKLQSFISVDNLKTACLTGNPISDPHDYVDLSDYEFDALNAMKQSLNPAPQKASVILLDVALLDAPNLNPRLRDSPPPTWTCNWAEFRPALHHSTHLAGIVAGYEKFGFRGLGQNVGIVPFVWEKPKDDHPEETEAIDAERKNRLADQINETAPEVPLPLYLAATTFGWDLPVEPSGLLANPAVRFQSILENRIKFRRSLFVVSAGQATDPEAKGIELTLVQPMSPQNMGDLPNVLVVTACETCTRTKTRLLGSANFSSGERRFVHVIAPGGKPIPGWISDTSIGAGAGTSQAAAYVAGIAASMISNFPMTYTEASLVKARIQITSRPLSLAEDGSENPESAKINAGLVDPVLALLDPKKHWIKQNGQWREVKFKSVSSNILTLRGAGGQNLAKIGHIRRAVKITAAPAKPQWTLFLNLSLARNDVPEDEVQRLGPGQPTAPSEMFTLCGATKSVKLEEIEDLIIAVGGFKPNASC